MRRTRRSTVFFISLLLVVFVAAGFAAQHVRLFERAWFNARQLWEPVDPQSINLGEYQAVLQGQKIEGLEDDVSALTYDPLRKSLFTVTNKQAELVELSLDGRILRRIPLIGFGDAEAVEFIGPDTYVITDERQQRLIKVHVDDSTQVLDAAHAELKSMRTAAAWRGQGVAAQMLVYVMDQARAAGHTRMSLETGSQDFFAPARTLYARHGFMPCAHFGSYQPDPHSCFMTRAL